MKNQIIGGNKTNEQLQNKYNDEINKSKEENNKLNEEIKKLNEEINKLNEELNKSKNELKSKNQDISNLQGFKDKIYQMEKEKTEMNNRLLKISNDNDISQKENIDLKKQIDISKRENSNLKKENEDLKKQIETSKKENNNIKKENEEMKIKLELTKKENNDKESLENKHKEELDRINFNHSLSLNELQLKYDGEISNLKIENMKLKGNNNKVTEYEEVIKTLKKQIIKKDEERNKKEEYFKKSQVEIFTKMKKDFMEAMDILQQKNEHLEKEIDELENYISTRPPREKDLETISKLNNELDMKEQEISELKDILNNNGLSNTKKIKLLNTKDKKQKYTNANYGMIYSKK